LPVEPLNIHIAPRDILVDGKPIEWWIKNNVRVELLPPTHEGTSTGAIVWVGIYTHDITVDPEADFVKVQQQRGCSEHGVSSEPDCPEPHAQLEAWRDSNVHPQDA
jgi:hypothetical protein